MIDEISLKILKILQARARIPNAEIARQVGMAPSAVLERIRKLEKMGFINGYEVRLNPKRFNKNMLVFITVKIDKLIHANQIGSLLAGLEEVQEVHYITAEDAFFLKVRLENTKALCDFINQKIAPIKFIRSTRTAIALSTFKETGKIPLESNEK